VQVTSTRPTAASALRVPSRDRILRGGLPQPDRGRGPAGRPRSGRGRLRRLSRFRDPRRGEPRIPGDGTAVAARHLVKLCVVPEIAYDRAPSNDGRLAACVRVHERCTARVVILRRAATKWRRAPPLAQSLIIWGERSILCLSDAETPNAAASPHLAIESTGPERRCTADELFVE
jgi:hypothetical protein